MFNHDQHAHVPQRKRRLPASQNLMCSATLSPTRCWVAKDVTVCEARLKHFRGVSVPRQPEISKAKWKGNGKKMESRYTCTRTCCIWDRASIHKSHNWPPQIVVLAASQRQHEESANKVTATTQVAQCCTLGLAELLCINPREYAPPVCRRCNRELKIRISTS